MKYAFLLLIFVSCKKENAFDCFKPNGKTMSEIRYPGFFSVVKVSDKIDVEIVQGSEYKVIVLAYTNVIGNISTTVNNGTLSIANNNTCNFVRGYKKNIQVSITVPDLQEIENWGVGTTRIKSPFVQGSLKIVAESSGDIHVDGIFGKLVTYSNGNGDIYLSGRSDSLTVFMNGTNFLYGEDFGVKDYALAETLSMGDCFLNLGAARTFEYSIYKSGNIYYRGNPVRISNLNSESAKGRLVKED